VEMKFPVETGLTSQQTHLWDKSYSKQSIALVHTKLTTHTRKYQTRNSELDARPYVLNASALKVLFTANFIPPWPWTLTFWHQNLKSSPLSQYASMVLVWWKFL